MRTGDMTYAKYDPVLRWVLRALTLSVVAMTVQACTGDSPTAPASGIEASRSRGQLNPRAALVQQVRALAAQRGIVPLPSAPYVRPALERLGRDLAFDKVI